MTKIVRLTESDIERIIERVLSEKRFFKKFKKSEYENPLLDMINKLGLEVKEDTGYKLITYPKNGFEFFISDTRGGYDVKVVYYGSKYKKDNFNHLGELEDFIINTLSEKPRISHKFNFPFVDKDEF